MKFLYIHIPCISTSFKHLVQGKVCILNKVIADVVRVGGSKKVVKAATLNIGLKSLYKLVHQSVSTKIRKYHSLSNLSPFESKVIVWQNFGIVADVMKKTKCSLT